MRYSDGHIGQCLYELVWMADGNIQYGSKTIPNRLVSIFHLLSLLRPIRTHFFECIPTHPPPTSIPSDSNTHSPPPSPYPSDKPPIRDPFIFGSFAGAVAWAVVFSYASSGSRDVPGFVWGILAAYVIMFLTFPINMVSSLVLS